MNGYACYVGGGFDEREERDLNDMIYMDNSLLIVLTFEGRGLMII